MKKVFISGSISINTLPEEIKKSIKKIKEHNILVLVGDASGVDSMVQKYCNNIGYINVLVYSVNPVPRFKINDFDSQYVKVTRDIKRERERQQEKDKAMTLDCDYSLVVWDGKSKGSYNNILRAIENNKKLKVYLTNKDYFLHHSMLNKDEIDFIFRTNNGYSSAEIVEYLSNEGDSYFKNTRAFNKYLLDNNIIKKENKIYRPMLGYEHLVIVDNYKGKIRGIKFNNDFINWIKQRAIDNKLVAKHTLF